MSKPKNNESISDTLTKLDEAALAKQASLDSIDDMVLDGEAILQDVLTSEKPKGVIFRVVKLKNTPENRTPALSGIFRGYEPVLVTPPGGGQPAVMNFVLIEVKPNLIAKHLGTSQIMQGMSPVRIGQKVTIIKPDAPDIEIGGGKRVKPFIVIPSVEEGTVVQGYAQPFGKYGAQYQLSTGNVSAALGSGEPDHDRVTGEVK